MHQRPPEPPLDKTGLGSESGCGTVAAVVTATVAGCVSIYCWVWVIPAEPDGPENSMTHTVIAVASGVSGRVAILTGASTLMIAAFGRRLPTWLRLATAIVGTTALATGVWTLAD